jgi:uncharacterized repeat protein (TIGR04052 family)
MKTPLSPVPVALSGLLSLLVACSSQDATLLTDADALRPQTGRVSLALTTGGVDVARLAYSVRDTGGRLVADGAREAGGDELRLDLDVPAGVGYSLSLTATSPGGVDCAGEARFDVAADARLELSIDLVCEPAGNVAVTGTLLSPDACPDVTLAPLAAPVAVGESVRLQAGADAAGRAITYAWASSGGSLEGALSAAATFTCTEPGPATLTLTATLDTCSDTASAVVECVAAAASACSDLGSTCHVVDPGSGPLHECHELGHGADEAACAAGRATCVEACGAELCSTLGSFCHVVDPGSGPLHECHELGHAGDADACFARGRECHDLCSEARAQAAEPITLRFAARVGAEPFACGSTYEGQGASGVAAEPQDFRFFVNDVRLIDASGREEPVLLDSRAPWQLPEVALLDFEDQSARCAAGTAETNDVITGRVFPGEYVGVAFELGVPEALNHDDPALAPAPLELGSMSWGWLLGYRFLRAELAAAGETDAGAPGIGLLHLGSTACTGNPQAGSVVCANPNRSEVSLPEFDPASSVIVADLGALFASTDLMLDAQCHSTGDFCAGPFASAGVDPATGAALPAQTLFRVE